MPTTYKFQISWPVSDTLPRNRMTNVLHFQHVTGGINDDALESMCSDLIGVYQNKYGSGAEFLAKAYDTDAVPNNPRASVIVNSSVPHAIDAPREVALVLSFSGESRGIKSERGRIYTCPFTSGSTAAKILGVRPSDPQLAWAMSFFNQANSSFPDLGGIDWKFGIYSPTYKTFTQAQQAWVNDDWDIQRRRGLRESKRVTAVREG